MQEVFDPMVTINGSPTPADGQTLAAYLTQAGYDPARVAVERNGDIVPKAQYASTVLEDGDALSAFGEPLQLSALPRAHILLVEAPQY